VIFLVKRDNSLTFETFIICSEVLKMSETMLQIAVILTVCWDTIQ
jgi:hypothetical protein